MSSLVSRRWGRLVVVVGSDWGGSEIGGGSGGVEGEEEGEGRGSVEVEKRWRREEREGRRHGEERARVL